MTFPFKGHVPTIDLPFGSDKWFPRHDGQRHEIRDWILKNAQTDGLSDEDIERADIATLAKILEEQYPGGFNQFAVDHRDEMFGGPGGEFRE